MIAEPIAPTSDAKNVGASLPLSRLPNKPDLVLRVGFAGNRELSDDARQLERLNQSLDGVLTILAQRLAEIASLAPVQSEVPKMARFYSKERPKLRLVTGLAEGADAMAAKALFRLTNEQVNRELAAVLPFDVKTYRESRSKDFRPDFDELARQCAYILTLDGRYEAGESGKRCRHRAYRAQSTVLLRHADILLVTLDPEKEGKAGGTMETIHAALAFDLPVIFIHAITGVVQLLEPGGTDVVAALSGELEAADTPNWKTRLREWVTNIVAEPDAGSSSHTSRDDTSNSTAMSHGERLLDEFFNGEQTPPAEQKPDGQLDRKKSRREQLWTRVESWFRPKDAPEQISDRTLEPYATYRRRATALNYHFSGLYRGAFVLNYVLAVAAVALAAFSLVLLGNTGAETAPSTLPSISPLFVGLLILGAVKLVIVVFIFRNTHQANHCDWNDKAVDYRYLAERLRTLFYLPRLGGFQPPAAAPPQYASRVVRQSAVDWLFDALVRSVSPATLPRPEPVSAAKGEMSGVPIIRLEVAAVLADVRDRWLGGQIAYHTRNARTMTRLHEFAERWGKRLNITVIIAVSVDLLLLLLLLLAELFHFLPHAWSHAVHAAAPWLVFLAALLPAAVASLNGIRFQSECRRLADRSAVVHAILGGREKNPEAGGRLQETVNLMARMEAARKNPATDPGAWSVEALHLSEQIARNLVQEVAEWSVLYAKEVVEP